MAFAISQNVTAKVATEQVKETAEQVKANNQNEGSIFDSEESKNNTVQNIMDHTNVSAEDAANIIANADAYAVDTLKTAADKDKGLTEAEWAAGRAGYIGASDEEMSKIFNAMDMDGDGHLDGQELFAAQLFKDVTSDYKDGNIENLDSYTIDGKVNVEEDNEHMASNMKALMNATGERIMQDMYSIAFGENSANIKAATGEYRDALRSATYDDTFKNATAAEREEFVEAWGEIYEKSLEKTYGKYADKDGYMYQDNWTQMVEDYKAQNEGTYVNNSESSLALHYMSTDLNGDGRISFEEMSAFASYTDGELSSLSPILDIAARQTGVEFGKDNTLDNYYQRAAEGTDDTFLNLVRHFRGIYSSINGKQGIGENQYCNDSFGGFTKAEWYELAYGTAQAA